MGKASNQLAAHLKCVHSEFGIERIFGIVMSKDLRVARLLHMINGVAQHDGYYPAAATTSLVHAINEWQE